LNATVFIFLLQCCVGSDSVHTLANPCSVQDLIHLVILQYLASIT